MSTGTAVTILEQRLDADYTTHDQYGLQFATLTGLQLAKQPVEVNMVIMVTKTGRAMLRDSTDLREYKGVATLVYRLFEFATNSISTIILLPKPFGAIGGTNQYRLVLRSSMAKLLQGSALKIAQGLGVIFRRPVGHSFNQIALEVSDVPTWYKQSEVKDKFTSLQGVTEVIVRHDKIAYQGKSLRTGRWIVILQLHPKAASRDELGRDVPNQYLLSKVYEDNIQDQEMADEDGNGTNEAPEATAENNAPMERKTRVLLNPVPILIRIWWGNRPFYLRMRFNDFTVGLSRHKACLVCLAHHEVKDCEIATMLDDASIEPVEKVVLNGDDGGDADDDDDEEAPPAPTKGKGKGKAKQADEDSDDETATPTPTEEGVASSYMY